VTCPVWKFTSKDWQTLKASTALLKHVRQEAKRLKELSAKKNLLEDEADKQEGSESGEQLAEDPPIWLNLTTKKHIVDKNRLKPGKIAVPHSINKSPSLSICLITADPQRGVKDVVAHPIFPAELSSKIGRVIGYTKLKAKYHSFESRRQLLAEHDIFLADDRIITRLLETLGKVFYKDSAKRPIPIRIARIDKVEGKRVKPKNKTPSSESKSATFATPSVIAKEIESAINSVPITLKPGTTAAVRVGRASFTPIQLSDNITTVASAMIDRYVARGWRNIKAIHIKSPTSAALPIWLADDLWVADTDVVQNGVPEELQKQKEADVALKRENRKKRKAEREASRPNLDPPQEQQQEHQKKKQKSTTTDETEDKVLDVARKSKLAQQKARALQASA
jgi:ribosome biogenesis protein UTP30